MSHYGCEMAKMGSDDLKSKRKFFKYNEDDILEILSEHLASESGFNTFNPEPS